MSDDLISVIVPIYNMAKYLNKCLDSIISQSYNNIEVILVDDGSRDESLEICKKYGRIDSRIIVIHQENKGVSAARNTGINIAKGAYITFVDPDDYIEKNMVEKLYYSIRKNNSDVVICGHRNINEDGIVYDDKFEGEQMTMSGEQGLIGLLDERTYNCVSWGKLYKKELFNEKRYNVETKLCEDLELLHEVFWKCNKITYIPDKLYIWLSRENSTTKQCFNDLWRGEIKICEKIIMFSREKCKSVEQYAIKRYIRVNLSCLEKIGNDFENEFNEIRKNLKKYKLRNKKILSNKKRIYLFLVLRVPCLVKMRLKKNMYNKRG